MSDTTTDRLTPFDWLRAGAAMGVVLLHACVPYLTHPMRGLAWPVRDTSSVLVNGMFWSIELFIMPLFLVIAGYFTVRLMRSHGSGGFLRNRAARLLLPLAVVGVVLLPMDLYSWLLGWVVDGRISLRKMQSLKFEAGVGDDLWGLSHLWFLQYLFLYCLVYAAAHAYWPRSWQTLSARYLLRRTSLYVLFAIGAAALTFAPEVVFGFQHGFLPFPSKWLYCGTFFAGGIWLAIYDTELRRTRRLGRRTLFVGVLASVAAVTAVGRHLAGISNPVTETLLVAATLVAAWGVTMGLIGVAMRYAHRSSRTVSYVAAASFWVYLVHHPLIGLVHTDLKILLPSATPLLKTLIAFSIASLWSLGSFQVLVRRTPLGRLLGIRQARRSDAAETRVEAETIPLQRAA